MLFQFKKAFETKVIDKVALLIPSYPNHYQILYNLLEKFNTNHISIDIYVIFSNKEDYEKFEQKDRIKPIIAENVPQDRSIIEYKRLYGLKKMINTSYSYIISCVSETDIIPENFTQENIMRKIDDIFNKKNLYGAVTSDNKLFTEIMTVAGSVFTGNDHHKLKSETKNLTLYTYFYDIPVYKREYIQDFLDKINYDTLKLTWYHFDNLMHNNYLIVHREFKVVDISAFVEEKGNGPLFKTRENVRKCKELGFGFSCLVGSEWKENRSIYEAERTFLLINTDR